MLHLLFFSLELGGDIAGVVVRQHPVLAWYPQVRRLRRRLPTRRPNYMIEMFILRVSLEPNGGSRTRGAIYGGRLPRRSRNSFGGSLSRSGVNGHDDGVEELEK